MNSTKLVLAAAGGTLACTISFVAIVAFVPDWTKAGGLLFMLYVYC